MCPGPPADTRCRRPSAPPPSPAWPPPFPLRAGAHRLSLLARVAALLHERRIAFAVVGAAAMAVHGVSRATRDLDVLVTDAVCLAESTWTTLRQAGIAVTIRR